MESLISSTKSKTQESERFHFLPAPYDSIPLLLIWRQGCPRSSRKLFCSAYAFWVTWSKRYVTKMDRPRRRPPAPPPRDSRPLWSLITTLNLTPSDQPVLFTATVWSRVLVGRNPVVWSPPPLKIGNPWVSITGVFYGRANFSVNVKGSCWNHFLPLKKRL